MIATPGEFFAASRQLPGAPEGTRRLRLKPPPANQHPLSLPAVELDGPMDRSSRNRQAYREGRRFNVNRVFRMRRIVAVPGDACIERLKRYPARRYRMKPGLIGPASLKTQTSQRAPVGLTRHPVAAERR